MARCGMCKRSENSRLNICHAGHQVKYPLMVNQHDCPDYEYEPAGEIVQKTPFNVQEHEYCPECAHHLDGVCSGKSWIPYKTEPRCEFFRDLHLTCKHALPFLQYGNGLRNNHCALRDDERCCNWAHISDHLDCYEPGYGKEQSKTGRKS